MYVWRIHIRLGNLGNSLGSLSTPCRSGTGKEDLALDDREWACEQCGAVNERDFNASLNIRDEALRLVTDVPVVASSGHKFACGAGSAGSLRGESEPFCDEAGTKML